MTTVFVRRQIHIPMIGTWKWKAEDYKVPLTFQFHGVRANLYLDSYEAGKRDRNILFQATLQLEFASPSADFLRGLRTSGKHGDVTARS